LVNIRWWASATCHSVSHQWTGPILALGIVNPKKIEKCFQDFINDMSDICHHMSPQNLQVSSFNLLVSNVTIPMVLWIAVSWMSPSKRWISSRRSEFSSQVGLKLPKNLKNKIDQDRSA
jgi:hypothetical protein